MSKTIEEKAAEFAAKYKENFISNILQADNNAYVAGIEVGFIWGQREYEEKLKSLKTEIKDTFDYLRDIQNEHRKTNSKSQVISYETCLSHFEDVLSSFL